MNDQQLNDFWTAAAHESLLCQESFHRFEMCGRRQIALAERGTARREENLAAYGAYADFLQHLYELHFALFAIERHNGMLPAEYAQLKESEQIDRWMQIELCRLLQGRVTSIKSGTAPAWENNPAVYEVPVPVTFPTDLRRVRNRTNHVSHKRTNPQRAKEMTLREFYDAYHVPFIDTLYRQATSGYLLQHTAAADWSAIEGFTVLAMNIVVSELKALFMASNGSVQEQYARLFCGQNLNQWVELGLIEHRDTEHTYVLTEKGRQLLT